MKRKYVVLADWIMKNVNIIKDLILKNFDAAKDLKKNGVKLKERK